MLVIMQGEKRRTTFQDIRAKRLIVHRTVATRNLYLELNRLKLANAVKEIRKKDPTIVGLWFFGSSTRHTKPNDIDCVLVLSPKDSKFDMQISEQVTQAVIKRLLGMDTDTFLLPIVVNKELTPIGLISQIGMRAAFRELDLRPENFIGPWWAQRKINEFFQKLEENQQKQKHVL